LFRFNQTSLDAVMRQLSRWYDVDIVYEGKIPDKKFGGGISRKTNLSQVLKILEESEVKFRIEGKKIIVNANQ
jgi:transmembrane sensor